jgi:hypothetical protein
MQEASALLSTTPYSMTSFYARFQISIDGGGISVPTNGIDEGMLGTVEAKVGITKRMAVYLRDAYGNPLSTTTPAALLDPPVVSPAGPTATLSDLRPGVAALDFTSATAGTFQVSVTASGVHVDGSPGEVQVYESLAGAVDDVRVWGSMVTGKT